MGHEPKDCLARILIVGASDAGISLLVSLLSFESCRFKNIVLISPVGLRWMRSKQPSTQLLATTSSFTPADVCGLGVSQRSRIIENTVVGLDRNQKCVRLKGDELVYYDILVITTGLQEDGVERLILQSPDNLKNGLISSGNPMIFERFESGSIWAESLLHNPLARIVVYGRDLDAYCVVHGLLSREVPGEKIFLVIPPVVEGRFCVEAFKSNVILETLIHKILGSKGVTILDEGLILDRTRFNRSHRVSGAIFKRTQQDDLQLTHASRRDFRFFQEKGEEFLDIDTRYVVTANTRGINGDIFNCVHSEGLVFDGRLIVDNRFQTCDKHILAGGSCAEFSPSYRRLAPNACLEMDRFSGREIGEKLAKEVVNLLVVNREGIEGLPQFRDPIFNSGVLPGHLYYYNFGVPQVEAGSSSARIMETNTITLNSKGEVESGQYGRLELDLLGRVAGVTYMGLKDINLHSMLDMIGMPSTLLNDLTLRFDAGEVEDLIDFLDEDWSIAVFHDKFPSFYTELISEIIQDIRDKHCELIVEDLGEFDNWSFDLFEDKDITIALRHKVKVRVFQFIKTHRLRLEQYFATNGATALTT